MRARFRNPGAAAGVGFASPAGKCYCFRSMKTKLGVTGSAGGESGGAGDAPRATAEASGRAVVLSDEDPGRLPVRRHGALEDSRGGGA
jgi:hypothetical protein